MTTRVSNTDSANNDVMMTTRGISRMHSSRDVKSQIELGWKQNFYTKVAIAWMPVDSSLLYNITSHDHKCHHVSELMNYQLVLILLREILPLLQWLPWHQFLRVLRLDLLLCDFLIRSQTMSLSLMMMVPMMMLMRSSNKLHRKRVVALSFSEDIFIINVRTLDLSFQDSNKPWQIVLMVWHRLQMNLMKYLIYV